MMRYSAVVAVASSTAPGVFETLMPITNVTFVNRGDGCRLTLGCTGGDVDLIVPSPIVRDPLDPRLSQGRDDFRIKDADFIGGAVVSIRADNPVVFSSRLEVLQEIDPVGRVHSLQDKKSLVQGISSAIYTDDDLRQTSEHLLSLSVCPCKVTANQNLGHRS